MLLSGTITALTALPDLLDVGTSPVVGLQLSFTTAPDAARHEILGAPPHRYRAVLQGPVLLAVEGLRVGDSIAVDAVLVAVRVHLQDGAGWVVGDLDVVSVLRSGTPGPVATAVPVDGAPAVLE